MDFYEVVEKRRTVRQFAARPVEENKLRRILAAGLKAPSHNQLWEWEFILLEDPRVRLEIVDKAEYLTETGEPVEPLSPIAPRSPRMPGPAGSLSIPGDGIEDFQPLSRATMLKAWQVQRQMLLSAPGLLVVCFRISRAIEECERIYDLNSFAAVWCCLENIMLAVTAEGLAAAAYIPKHTDKIRDILAIPMDYEIPALLPIGYAAENASSIPQKEILLDEKIHFNHFRA